MFEAFNNAPIQNPAGESDPINIITEGFGKNILSEIAGVQPIPEKNITPEMNVNISQNISSDKWETNYYTPAPSHQQAADNSHINNFSHTDHNSGGSDSSSSDSGSCDGGGGSGCD